MKVCATCKVEKPKDEFHRKADAFDGCYPHCKACRKINDARYRIANVEKLLAYDRERNKTPERKVAMQKRNKRAYEVSKTEWDAYARQYAREHPEQVRATKRAYKQRNPAKTLAATRMRQARKLNATPVWANQFFMEEAYDLARLRTEATGFEWQVDHVVPLQSKKVCGLHNEFNLQVIPAKQNQIKGNRQWPDMPSSIGFSL